MADIVTFDPVNLRIIEIDTVLGDNELSVAEIYSEWKAWLLADQSRLSYPSAFRFAGGDPISDTANLGSTFFIMNNWRIRPAERNHKLTLAGNIYTDPAGSDVVVDTLGAYNVRVVYRVSNLIDVISAGGSIPTAAQVAAAVWDEPVATHASAGTFGALESSHPTAASITNAVWNEPNGSHIVSGSTGDSLMSASLGSTATVDNAAIASAVWNEPVNAHAVSGSSGWVLDRIDSTTQIVSGTCGYIYGMVNMCYKVNVGRWKIDVALNQLIFYDSDDVTEIARFELLDQFGAATANKPFERRPI